MALHTRHPPVNASVPQNDDKSAQPAVAGEGVQGVATPIQLGAIKLSTKNDNVA